MKTADLYDQHGDTLQVLQPLLRQYGGKRAFAGKIVTVKVHEDNKLVRAELEKDGAGKVLVIDGGGSLRSALVGDKIAQLAIDHRWEGIVIYGCIRDSAEIGAMALGVCALATNPVRPGKNGFGQAGIPVSFGGVKFTPGEYLYADDDGVVVSARWLA